MYSNLVLFFAALSVSLNGVLLVLLALGIAMWRQLPHVIPSSAGPVAS